MPNTKYEHDTGEDSSVGVLMTLRVVNDILPHRTVRLDRLHRLSAFMLSQSGGVCLQQRMDKPS